MRGRRKLARGGAALLLAGAFVLYGVPAGARAADGDLDPTFGAGGIVITDFGVWHEAFAGVLQSDGKIIVAGRAGSSIAGFDFALARYNSDGSLDASFGGDGRVTTDFGGESDSARAVALQSDGKIVAAGYISDLRGNSFALARYDSNGELDPTFGGDGRVTTDFTGGSYAFAVVVQSDDKIVAAGLSNPLYAGYEFALARYNSDGSLDASFGGDGRVTTDFSYIAYANALTLQSDGKIVAAGEVYDRLGNTHFLLARYDGGGELDPTFGGDGRVTTDFSGSGRVYDVAVQGDGKIVAAGVTTQYSIPFPSYNFALARYDGHGELDPTFGGDGRVTTDFGGADTAFAVAVQSDGKIVAAGEFLLQFGTSTDFALARYNSDGSLDASFGGDGRVTTDFLSYSASARAVALQSDGKIVLAGTAYQSGFDFALARYEGTPPAQAQIEAVISAVNRSQLRAGTKTSLIAKLHAALAALQAGETETACGTLQAFLNYVHAQSGKKLPEAQAAELADSVNRISAGLGCPLL